MLSSYYSNLPSSSSSGASQPRLKDFKFWKAHFLVNLNQTLQVLPDQLGKSRESLNILTSLSDRQVGQLIDPEFKLQTQLDGGFDMLIKACPILPLGTDHQPGEGLSVVRGYGVSAGVQEAYQKLRRRQYDDAKPILEKELVERGFFVRILRRSFLKDIHYAVGHFLNAMIAEDEMNTVGDKHSELCKKAFNKAFAEYGVACKHAHKAGINDDAVSVHLMMRFQRIRLLKTRLAELQNLENAIAAITHSKNASLPMDEHKESSSIPLRVLNLMDNQLRDTHFKDNEMKYENTDEEEWVNTTENQHDNSPLLFQQDRSESLGEIAAIQKDLDQEFHLLKEYFNNEFKQLFFYIERRMLYLVGAMFLSTTQPTGGGLPLTGEQLEEINALLRLECLPVFEKMENGYGSFLSLVTTFFRALSLSYFAYVDNGPACIKAETYAALQDDENDEFNGYTDYTGSDKPIVFAAQQILKFFKAINDFKQKYSLLLQKPALKNAISFMEDFSVNFICSHDKMKMGYAKKYRVIQTALTYIQNDHRLNEVRKSSSKKGASLLRLKNIYGGEFYSHEAWLKAILDESDRQLNTLIDGPLSDLFQDEFTSFPKDAFSSGQTPESMSKVFSDRVVLRRLNQACDSDLPSLQAWFKEVQDLKSEVIWTILVRNPTGRKKLFDSFDEFKKLKGVTEHEVKRARLLLNERFCLARFLKGFGRRFDNLEECIAALNDETDESITLLLKEKREKLDSFVKKLEGNWKEQAEKTRSSLRKRALLLDVNTQFEAKFEDIEECVEAILDIGNSIISPALLQAQDLNILLERFVKAGIPPEKKLKMQRAASLSLSWMNLLNSLRKEYSANFATINDLLAALADDQDQRVTRIITSAPNKLVEQLRALPYFSEVWKKRVDHAIAQLNGRIFLAKLNEKYGTQFKTFPGLIQALGAQDNEKIKQIAKIRGNELLETLETCPECILDFEKLKQAVITFARHYFLAQLKIMDSALEFGSFKDASLALNDERQKPHEGLASLIKNVKGSELIELINAFPEHHPDKKALQAAVPKLKKRFMAAEFTQIMQLNFSDLDDCLSFIKGKMEATYLEKFGTRGAEIREWLSKLDSVGILPESIEEMSANVRQYQFLFRLNAEIKIEVEEKTQRSYQKHFVSIQALLYEALHVQNAADNTEVAELVRLGVGRNLYEQLNLPSNLGVSEDRVKTSRDSLIKAILLHELKQDFCWEVAKFAKLDECLTALLEQQAPLKELFKNNLGARFLIWIKELPSCCISAENLEKVVCVIEGNLFLFGFNEKFSFNFKTLDDCFAALLGNKDSKIDHLLKGQGSVLIAELQKWPESSSAMRDKKKLVLQCSTRRRLLNELETDFAGGSVRNSDLDGTLMLLSKKLTFPEAKGNDALLKKRARETGRTLLHWLASFEEGIAQKENVNKLAKHLLELRYVRDKQNQTAEVLLKENDPFQLLSLIAEVTPPANKAQLTRVDEFLERVKQDSQSGRSDREQFILLEGPPGTGKTTTVTQYLANRPDCEVRKWDKGTENDMYANQIETRIKAFFDTAHRTAIGSGKIQILFIDEMDSVCRKVNGDAKAGYYDQRKTALSFQEQITGIKGKRIVVIGTTNFPESIAEAILKRAEGGRIDFPLPNKEERELLLTHTFRKSIFSEEQLRQLVGITTGWAPRELIGIASRLVEAKVLDENLIRVAFQNVSHSFEKQFIKEHPSVKLRLPVFKAKVEEGVFNEQKIIVDEKLAVKMDKIMLFLKNPTAFPKGLLKHALLYGSPGGGKTFAINQLVTKANLPYLSVQGIIDPHELQQVFTYAEQFQPALIFFDEVDDLLRMPGNTECMQINMDGEKKTDVVVLAATNYPDRIPVALRDRFEEIEVPPLSSAAKRTLIAQEIQRCLVPHARLRPAACLQKELDSGCSKLESASGNLSMRRLVRALQNGLGVCIASEIKSGKEEIPVVTLEKVLTFVQEEENDNRRQFSRGVNALPANAAQLIQRFGSRADNTNNFAASTSQLNVADALEAPLRRNFN